MASRGRPGADRGVERIESLDGLRGVAAVVVVLCHSLLIVPVFSASIVDGVEPAFGTPEWMLLRTPLRLFTMGAEAVMVFFVLSGFVLTLGFIGRTMTPRFVGSYLVRRAVRLYVPVWGSLVLALILATLVARNTGAPSSWLASHQDPSAENFFLDMVLLFGSSNLNSPLWSLTWEVWFSLLLPVIWQFFRAVRVERWWLVAVPVLILVSCAAEFRVVRELLPVAHITGGLMKYLPVFCIGMILALKVSTLRGWYRRSGRRSRALVWSIVGGLLVIPALFEPFGASPPLVRGEFWILSLLGAAGLVVLAIVSRRASGFFASPPVMFFGRRSFSLYLVHEPIIVASALVLGSAGWLPWVAVLPLVYAAIIVCTMAFYRWVEKPSIWLSRAAGRALRARTPVVARV